MSTSHAPTCFRETPDVPADLIRRVRSDHDGSLVRACPRISRIISGESYGLDMTASYAGTTIRNPWGKASGQLSLNASQIEEAADAGLGFVVLKTVIAQDAAGPAVDVGLGDQGIADGRRADHQPDRPARRAGRSPGRGGGGGSRSTITSTWCAAAARSAAGRGTARRPLGEVPPPGAASTRPGGRRSIVETTRQLAGRLPIRRPVRDAMPLEKDFSPTLAGSDRAGQRAVVLEWLSRVPDLIRSAGTGRQVKVGLKLFNSLEGDDFQLAMLAEVHGESRPDYPRLRQSPFRSRSRVRGPARRRLRRSRPERSEPPPALRPPGRRRRGARSTGQPLEISATGDISSGRIAVEYALRGCTSFQIHTLFQLPAAEFAMRWAAGFRGHCTGFTSIPRTASSSG